MSELLNALLAILFFGSLAAAVIFAIFAIVARLSRPGTQQPGKEDPTVALKRDLEAEWAARYPTREHGEARETPMNYVPEQRQR